jgi:LPXTG-motif cell wall-anchored protein
MAAVPTQSDFFDKARRWAVIALVIAGLSAAGGSLLNWVTIEASPQLQQGINFGGRHVKRPSVTKPFTGLEARDGWWTLAGGTILMVAGGLLLARRRAVYAWLAFLASMVIGAVVIADYRQIGELSSDLSRRMHIVGDAAPGVGIVLVAVGGLLGLIASVAALAASPRIDATPTKTSYIRSTE